MIGKRDRLEIYWREVGQTLGLEDAQVQTRRPLFKSRFSVTAHLVGTLGRFEVEAGVHHSTHEERDPGFTYAAVTVDGLPPGFEVGPWRAQHSFPLLGPRPTWIACGSSGGTEVKAGRPRTTSVEVGGLVTEYEGFDLDTFLTPRRRQVLCLLDGQLHWMGGTHQLRTTMAGHPYPGRRDVSRAGQGDVEAKRRLSASQDKVAELVRTCMQEAEVVARELSVGP